MPFIKRGLLFLLFFSYLLSHGVYYLGKKKYYKLSEFFSPKEVKKFCNFFLQECSIPTYKGKIRIIHDFPYYSYQKNLYSLPYPSFFASYEVYIPISLGKFFRILKKKKIASLSRKKKPIKDSSFFPKATPSLKFIWIDAGHGGKDPGAYYHKIQEKKITQKVALFLYRKLKKAFPKSRVYLTRRRDTFLSLAKRVHSLNKRLKGKKNTLGIFISLHCNFYPSPHARGLEVYFLKRPPSIIEYRIKKILKHILPKNHTKEVHLLEAELLEKQIAKESKMLAFSLYHSLISSLRGMIPPKGILRKDFFILRETLAPAVLIEMGYLSHPKERKILQSLSFRKKFAKGIIQGIKTFLREYPSYEKRKVF